MLHLIVSTHNYHAARCCNNIVGFLRCYENKSYELFLRTKDSGQKTTRKMTDIANF